MRFRHLVLLTVAGGTLAFAACTQSSSSKFDAQDDDAASNGGAGGANTGGTFFPQGGSDQGGSGGIIENPCGSECGDEELCDGSDAGLDNDCDGVVDEGCQCSSGAAQPCFKGDPSFRSDPGCFDGTQKCNELGVWGECTGGVHATDMCFSGGNLGCHPIQSAPYVTADMATGLGNFGADAVSATYVVSCPAGVTPCPAPAGAMYTPLQSGEYTVTYVKTLSDNSTEECIFPLFVGAPGLRVELTWEWDDNLGAPNDVDLHLHRPGTLTPWGDDDDCYYANCDAFSIGSLPTWFPAGNTPPDPVNWFLDPVVEKNTCYFAPQGAGAEWQLNGQGCHNPRLDADNISCSPTETDSTSSSFCNPENINIDFPSTDWTRVAVHYYDPFPASYNVHPVVRIFCDGALSAELGASGFNAPVTFTPGDGGSAFWLVADVAFVEADECDTGPSCTVRTLYNDEVAQTPLIVTESAANAAWVGPNYPPTP